MPKLHLDLENGATTVVQDVTLDDEDAALLRVYKRFLEKYRLREALYCQDCWNQQRADGCEAHVTAHDVLIRCRCTARRYHGVPS